MTRTLLVVAAATLSWFSLPAVAAAAPPIARPNPAFVSPQVDYVNALPSASGGVASLAPLELAVINQAVADQKYLRYLRGDDLGGFVQAPVGNYALSTGGHNVVGAGGKASQLPQFDQAASGDVRVFAFLGGPTPPPESGLQPVPGLGVPPPVPTPTNSNTVPPPNSGFGGHPTPTPPGGTTTTGPSTTTGPGTTTSPKPPPRTTPTTTTTTTPTTTTAPPTTTAPTTTSGGGSPPPSGHSCGTIGMSLESDLTGCVIHVVNMAPGDSTFERTTIRNDSGAPFTLSLKATGTPNGLWNDLQMGVWEINTPAPAPLPALLWWTLQQNTLTTLQPGASVTFNIELALPSSAGNSDQGKAATIDFHWYAAG